jgi:hypothetical protein
MDGKRYTLESLNRLWRHACKETGESIDMYSGLKHSSGDHRSYPPGFSPQMCGNSDCKERKLMDSSGKNLACLLKVVK